MFCLELKSILSQTYGMGSTGVISPDVFHPSGIGSLGAVAWAVFHCGYCGCVSVQPPLEQGEACGGVHGWGWGCIGQVCGGEPQPPLEQGEG